MKQILNLLRWILVFPLMIIIGSFINLIIIAILNIFGDKLLNLLYYPLEYCLLPAVIGYFIVRYGPIITPEHNIKTLNKLFVLLIIFEIMSIFILAPNTELTKDFLPTQLQIIKSFFSIIGGLVGMYIFRKDWARIHAK